MRAWRGSVRARCAAVDGINMLQSRAACVPVRLYMGFIAPMRCGCAESWRRDLLSEEIKAKKRIDARPAAIFTGATANAVL